MHLFTTGKTSAMVGVAHTIRECEEEGESGGEMGSKDCDVSRDKRRPWEGNRRKCR